MANPSDRLIFVLLRDRTRLNKRYTFVSFPRDSRKQAQTFRRRVAPCGGKRIVATFTMALQSSSNVTIKFYIYRSIRAFCTRYFLQLTRKGFQNSNQLCLSHELFPTYVLTFKVDMPLALALRDVHHGNR